MFGQYFIQEECSDGGGTRVENDYDYVCEVDYDIPVEDNFYATRAIDEAPVIEAGLMLSGSFIILTVGFGLKCLRDIDDKYLIFICFSVLFNMLALGLEFNSELETCSFPRWCHEGVNDTIVPSYYYYQREKCPRINAWIPEFYEDRIGTGTIDCDNTDYGCCEIREINCESCFREGDSYSFYEYLEERNVGHWTLNIEKEDEKGNNCPTIEEMILEISDEKNIYETMFICTFINCLLLLIVYLMMYCCSKIETKYVNVNENVNEEEVDEENIIFKESTAVLIGSA